MELRLQVLTSSIYIDKGTGGTSIVRIVGEGEGSSDGRRKEIWVKRSRWCECLTSGLFLSMVLAVLESI